MYKYDLILQEGHPLIQTDGQTLVLDTGNPASFAENRNISIADRDFPCGKNMMMVDCAYLSRQLGCEIHGMIGNDILKQFCIKFDYANKSVHFSPVSIEPAEGAAQLPLTLIMDVPSISMSVEGTQLNCVVDTGAKLGYMPEELCQGRQQQGVVNDFFPMAGEFQTRTYRLDSSIGDQSFSGTYGNLPAMLNFTLSMVGIEGIVGYDFFSRFCVTLDQPNNMLYLSPNN